MFLRPPRKSVISSVGGWAVRWRPNPSFYRDIWFFALMSTRQSNKRRSNDSFLVITKTKKANQIVIARLRYYESVHKTEHERFGPFVSVSYTRRYLGTIDRFYRCPHAARVWFCIDRSTVTDRCVFSE